MSYAVTSVCLCSSCIEHSVEFTQPLVDQTVPEKATLTLECAVTKLDLPTATWLKKGEEVPFDGRHEMCVEGAVHRLVIYDVTPEDSGEYTCKINGLTSTAKVLVEGM